MKNFKINLLQQKEAGLTDKLIFFSFHYLRYIIVITQIVVISVFFYRFKVDQSIIDLKETIDQKGEILELTRPLVTEASAIETKTNEIKRILDGQDRFVKYFNSALTVIPESVILTQYSQTDAGIELVGSSATSDSIKQLRQRLKSQNIYSAVTINQISIGSSGYDFSISLIY